MRFDAFFVDFCAAFPSSIIGNGFCLPDLLLACLSALVDVSEVFLTVVFALDLTLLKFPSRIHWCCKPSSGVMRFVGSQLKSKHKVHARKHVLEGIQALSI